MAQLVRSFAKLSLRSVSLCRITQIPANHMGTSLSGRGRFSKKHSEVLRSLWHRREAAGPEKERHRSEWLNWNRDSEIFCFGKRLGEGFKKETLSEAFVDSSHVEQMKIKFSEKQVEDAEIEAKEEDGDTKEEERETTQIVKKTEDFNMTDNSSLSQIGEKLATTYIKAFLRYSHPALPEEGISAICDSLMSDSTLAHVGRNIGMRDLILCDVIHPSDAVVSKAFKAVLGALNNDQGSERVHLFVQDMVLTQLIGKDINEMWNIVNPVGLLEGVMAKEGMASPEPRLIGSAGSETVEAAYFVGIYSDKKMISKGYGETVAIAQEMAARTALRKYFGTTDSRKTYAFGDTGRQLELDMGAKNISTIEYMKHAQLQ